MARAITTLLVAASLAIAATVRAEDAGVTVGRYEGTAFNTTANQGGRAVLEITAASAGKVQARFAASDGLSGEGWLSGTLAGGTLTLSGPLAGWRMSLTASARPGGALAGTYVLEGEGKQEGRIEVTRRGPASPVLAAGEPPLSEEMATRFVDLYDGLLELDLDAAGRQRVTGILAGAWRKNDRTAIELVLEDLTSTSGKSLEAVQANFGPDERLALAESSRRGAPYNVVLAALMAAFDQAHPDRVAATRARGFSATVHPHWGTGLPSLRGALPTL